MAVRSTQGKNRAVRSTPGGKGVSPSLIARSVGLFDRYGTAMLVAT